MLIVDFETRSRCDLTKAGADKYAADPSTEVLCMAAYDTETDNEWLWAPALGALPVSLDIAIERTDFICAHNARFDQAIWEYAAVRLYGFPEVPREQWYCSSAQMRVNALPASLENACIALNVMNKKDHRGSYLIRKLSIPDKDTGQFNNDPDLMSEMYQYCTKDVRATRDIVAATRRMSDVEHRDWLVNEWVNDNGVRIDIPLASRAQDYATAETDEINKEISALTGGEVGRATQRARVAKWVKARVSGDVEIVFTKYVDDEKKFTLEKAARENFFALVAAQDISVSTEVYDVLCCYDNANKSSVAKFKRMTDMAMHDEKVRGAFVYAGASTLRFTSRGLQLHNFKRDCYSVSDADSISRIMMQGHKLDSVMDRLGKLLRPALIPCEGNSFVVNDWSSVENRMLPWLSDDRRADDKLDKFREIDADPNAEDTYQLAAREAGVSDRQVGKVIELSLGFLGANGAFNSMARAFGIKLPEQEVSRIVGAWRVKNAWAVDFGNKLEKAAKAAVKHPHMSFTAGRVAYHFNGTDLFCTLPSGTLLTYPQARIEKDGKYITLTALKANLTPAAGAAEWPRFNLWRGLLAENATQAECATLLREALRGCYDSGIKVVIHCHDEIVAECRDSEVDWTAKSLERIMREAPLWAEGLPLKAEPTVSKRYGK